MKKGITAYAEAGLDIFPRAAFYRALGAPAAGRVAEAPRAIRRFLYAERHLQCVWADDRLRPATLLTLDGEPVVVEYPGTWNQGAGPDFLGAALRVGAEGRRMAGDVEIHVAPGDWQAHGHARDPRYAGVRVHVTYFPGAPVPDQFPAGAIHIALRDALAANPCFSFESIDLAAYPLGFPAAPTPCALRLQTWPADQVGRLLDAAGEERLRRKAARLAAALETERPAQVFYEEYLSALGYHHNKTPCRQLARRVPLEVLRRESGGNPMAAYALLAGVAQLLPERPSGRWPADSRRFVREAWDLWWKIKDRWPGGLMAPGEWRRGGIRPANQPLRRLMAAARLFARPEPPVAALQAVVSAAGAQALPRLLEHLQSVADPFWDHHLTLAAPRRPERVALVGPQLAAAMVTNVVVPFLAALDPGGRDPAALLGAIPREGDNAVIRRTAATLLGPDHQPKLYRSGLRQQGLIQIYQDYCLNERAQCSQCRLPDALAAAGGR